MLGSLIPSSRFVVNRVLGEVDWPRARLVLEYGPGVGTLTAEILRRMRPDARLIAIEMNGDFVAYLRSTLPDPRLQVVHGSAAEAVEIVGALGPGSCADYVLSGIPFATMPAPARERVLVGTRAVLQPRGAFLVYQFTRAVLPYLRREFGDVRQAFEPRNVMPARLFFCRRPRVASGR